MSRSVGRQSTVVASVLLAMVLALTFSFGGHSQAATPINTYFETRTCLDGPWPPSEAIGCTSDLTAGAVVDRTTLLVIPSPGPNFNQEIGVVSFTTPDATFHEDTVPIGAMVGAYRQRSTLGVVNLVCGPPKNVDVQFAFFNSTVDDSDGNLIHPTLPQVAGGLGTLGYFGTDTGNRIAPENGIPAHVERYPSYLRAMLDPDFLSLGADGIYNTGDDVDGAADPVTPLARYSSYTEGAGMGVVGVVLEYVIFAPGGLASAFDDPHPYSDLTADLGYAGIFVLNDPTAPDAPSYISDLCSVYSSTHLAFGASRDNSCTDGSADPYTGPCDTWVKLNNASTAGDIPSTLWAGTPDPDGCDADSDESGCVRYRNPAANTGYKSDIRLVKASNLDASHRVGVAVKAGDDDIGNTLVAFNANEMHTDPVGPTRFNVGEWVYRNLDGGPPYNTVSNGDTRLVHPTLGTGVAVICPGDADCGKALVAFASDEKHDETVNVNGQFNPGEGIYRDANGSDDVSVSGTGTHRYPNFMQTLRDADNDGLENSFDTCPYTATLGYNPRLTDYTTDNDQDAIPGVKVIDGLLDVNLPTHDNAITGADDGTVAGKNIIDGFVDMDGKDGITTADDGVLLGFDVDDGYVDMDGDDSVPPDTGDDGTINGCDPTPNANSGFGNHDGDVGGAGDDPYPNAQDNCPLAANGSGEDNQKESELDQPWSTAAPNGGSRSDDIGDACDLEDEVANGHYHTFLNLGLQDRGGGYEAVSCIGASDTDGDGVCDATEDALGSYKYNKASTPESIAWDYSMPLTNRGSGPDDDSDGVPANDDADDDDPGVGGTVDDDAVNTPAGQEEEPFQSCNDDIDNDSDGLKDDEEADCNGASANPDSDLDGIPDTDEDACSTVAGIKNDATKVPERLGNSTAGEGVYQDVGDSDTVTDDDIRLVHDTLPVDVAVDCPADADCDTALVDFAADEKHADPADSGVYNPGEGIYRDVVADNIVGIGDTRLVHATLPVGRAVAAGDADVGTAVVAFAADEKHADPADPGVYNGRTGDDDGDGLFDEVQAAVSGSDCDGDGFNDDVEAALTWPAQVGPTAETEGAGQCNDYFDDDATDSGENLTADLDNIQTDVAVTDGTTFSVGDVIKVGLEDYIKITGIVGNTLTVQRGVPKLPHSTGDDVFDKDGVVNDGCPEPGLGHQERCGDSAGTNNENDDQWPADFNDDQKLNIADVNIFASPIMHFNQLVANHHRWDLSGSGTKINLVDVNLLGTKRAPMFYVQPAGPSYGRVFGNSMYGASGKCPADDLSPPP